MRQLKQKMVKQLMLKFGISRQDAELVWEHPNSGHVVSYALARHISVRTAMESGQLFKVSDPRAEDDGADHAYAWAVTAYEAWLQVQRHISTRPEFGLCEFEVVDG